MEHTIEHKVLHREWDEVTFSASVFFENQDKFVNEDGENYDLYPTFEFENGIVYADEMWDVKDGRVSTSSLMSGVMSWSDEKSAYIEYVHFRERNLGALKSVTFTLGDTIQKIIEL